MTGLLTNLVPMIAAQAPARDEEEFVRELRNMPEGWLAFAGLALLVGLCWSVVWLYRREGRIGASPQVRMLLAGLRCAVIIILAAILLEPVRVRILRRWIDSYTIVLVDDSSSMDLADQYDDAEKAARIGELTGSDAASPVRRREIAGSILARDDYAFLENLAERNRVKVYTFGGEPALVGMLKSSRERRTSTGTDNAQGVASDPDRLGINLEGKGPATNIERAVRRSVDSVGSSPVSGLVLISDGGANQGALPEDVARFAASRRLPIHVIGVGDPAPPRNVRVTNVDAPENAFKQDPFGITAELSVQGLTGATVEIELLEKQADAAQEGTVVDRRSIVVANDGAIEPVTFERRQTRTGRYNYEIRVPLVGRESVSDDNSKQLTVNVIESRTRVLVVAGSPGWDYRYVTRLFERDETFDVSCWLQSADRSAVRDGNTIIDHLPRQPDEIFEYDVIILMDPERSEFDDPWCRLIDTWVTEHGGGLMYTAARAHSPDFLRDRTLVVLHDLLPVTLDPEADLVLNRIGHYQLKGTPFQIEDASLGHPVLRMAADSASTRLAWQANRDVYWHYPVLREKPVATVLMRHGDPRMRNSFGEHVLGAVQYVGAGRTGFVGFDGTWRWRRSAPERFERFWVQAVRYLAEGKLLGGTRRGTIQTESDEFALGESVTVNARLFNERFEPVTQPQVIARLECEGERSDLILQPRSDRAGWYQGKFVPDQTGSYLVRLRIPDASSGEPLEVSKEIYVTRPNVEILNPQMNLAGLTAIAEGSAGGKYFHVAEAAQLPELIKDLHEEIIVRSRPSSLWDNGAVLGLLLTLLVVEWAVRKWSRLL